MIDLEETYRRLARPWTREQLAPHYHAADRRGAQPPETGDDGLNRPIAMLAIAIPATATLSVAIHVLHMLPQPADRELDEQLIATAGSNAAAALHRCHRALELDGADHGYSADEWLPVIYDTAAPLLEASRLDQEPPSIVRQTQDAVSWLARAIADLDQGSPEGAASLAETLARLLTVWVFAEETPDDSGR